MGNYGNTLDRWYHRAAIVVWRKEDYWLIRWRMNREATLQDIDALFGKGEVEEARRAISSIVDDWDGWISEKAMDSLLRIAAAVDSRTVAKEILKGLGPWQVAPTYMQGIVRLIETYGEEWMVQVLRARAADAPRYERSFLAEPGAVAESLLGYREVVEFLLKWQVLQIRTEDEWSVSALRIQRVDKANEQTTRVGETITACLALKMTTLVKDLLNHVLECTQLCETEHLADIWSWIAPAAMPKTIKERFRKQVRNRIESEVAMLENLGTWAIHLKSSCTCELCKKLNLFLGDGSKQEDRWPLAEAKRSHLHSAIDGLGVPVSHTTLRQGRPYTLIVKKKKTVVTERNRRVKLLRRALVELG